jgi:endonuclease IV
MKALAKAGVEGVLICESPNGTDDALMLKSIYDSFT